MDNGSPTVFAITRQNSRMLLNENQWKIDISQDQSMQNLKRWLRIMISIFMTYGLFDVLFLGLLVIFQTFHFPLIPLFHVCNR